VSLKSDYVEYALQAALSILAVASIYLLDTSRTVTYLYLLTLPLLLSYTAYISSESFQNSSFISFITIFFIPLGPLYALASIFIISSNVFVSYFSRGETFKEFYSSITLPLLFSGILLGASVFALFNLQPEIAQQTSVEASELLSQQTDEMNQKLGINSTGARNQLVKTVSTLTVSLTQSYVLDNSAGKLSPDELQNVSNAFDEAKTEVPSRIVEQTSKQTPDIQEVLSGVLSNIFNGPMTLILIPLIAGLIYALNPVLGITMGVIGVLIRKVDGYMFETS